MLKLLFSLFFLFFVTTPCLALSPQGAQWIQETERQMQQADRSLLQGAWYGKNGQSELILFFMHNICGMRLEQKVKYGLWELRGRTLLINFLDKTINFQVKIEKDRLFLDDIVLMRYSKDQQQPSRADIPGFGRGKTLSGHWVYKAAFGMQEFIFTNHNYMYLVNGREVERGTYVFDGQKMTYTITQGTKRGESGEYRVRLENDLLILSQPAGGLVKFRKK